MKPVLRAPFPWFGGKSRAASLIWEGLGDVANYVEPFAGSLVSGLPLVLESHAWARLRAELRERVMNEPGRLLPTPEGLWVTAYLFGVEVRPASEGAPGHEAVPDLNASTRRS